RLHGRPSRRGDRPAGRLGARPGARAGGRSPRSWCMSAFFITATGTDVGKTCGRRGLTRALRARGRAGAALKPIVSGFEPAEAEGSDSGLLLAALGREPTLEAIAEISPWRFQAPLSPDMAAVREKRTL